MFNKLAKWAKDLYYTQQRKPNEPEITYQKQEDNIVERREIVFPDGNKLQLHKEKHVSLFSDDVYYSWYVSGSSYSVLKDDIPNFSTWQPPMVELFLLMLKDRKNWVHSKTEEEVGNNVFIIHSYTHNNLGMIVKVREWRYSSGRDYSAEGICISNGEVGKVIDALNLYQYTDKMLRLKRIKDIRKERIENEKRNADAKRIREYLESK